MIDFSPMMYISKNSIKSLKVAFWFWPLCHVRKICIFLLFYLLFNDHLLQEPYTRRSKEQLTLSLKIQYVWYTIETKRISIFSFWLQLSSALKRLKKKSQLENSFSIFFEDAFHIIWTFFHSSSVLKKK